jgi:hypothetical protein
MCQCPQSSTCSFHSTSLSTARRKSLSIIAPRDEQDIATNTTTPTTAGLDLESGYNKSNLDCICPICLDVFRVGDTVAWSLRLTSCPHVFHSECIQLWLTSSHYDCPCCRGDFHTRTWARISSADHDAARTVNESIVKRGHCGGIMLIEKRNQGRFCIRHGLMIPS